MNRRHFRFGLVASVLLLAACTTKDPDSGEQDTTSAIARPSISVTVEAAPTQYNQGRGTVAFDPCFGLGDETIVRAGFDPVTRERNDFIFDSYSFVGCSFEQSGLVGSQQVPVRSLRVWSSNITLDEFRLRYEKTSKSITVDGSRAIQYTNPGGTRDACNIAVESTDGVLDIGKIVHSAFTEELPCDHIVEIASTIAEARPAS